MTKLAIAFACLAPACITDPTTDDISQAGEIECPPPPAETPDVEMTGGEYDDFNDETPTAVWLRQSLYFPEDFAQ